MVRTIVGRGGDGADRSEEHRSEEELRAYFRCKAGKMHMVKDQ